MGPARHRHGFNKRGITPLLQNDKGGFCLASIPFVNLNSAFGVWFVRDLQTTRPTCLRRDAAHDGEIFFCTPRVSNSAHRAQDAGILAISTAPLVSASRRWMKRT